MQRLIIKILGTYLNIINRLSKRVGGKHAFLLFCYPFSAKLKPKQLSFLATARQSFFDFKGKKIAVYSWGSGPTIILCLHGWQSHSYRWKRYVETIDLLKYKILSIDAPAHGQSEGRIFNVPIYAQLIEDLLAQYKVDFVLAHSLGAFAAMCLFYEKPHLSVQRIALLGVPGEATDFISEYGKVLRVHPRVIANLASYFEQYAGLTPSYYSTTRFASAQTASALLIHDVGDQEAPYYHAEKIVKRWPNATLYTTHGLGHKLRDMSVVHAVVDFFEN